MPAADTSASEARRYAGREKRACARIPESYPLCVRFISASGEVAERYAQTRDVSAKGVLFSCVDALEIGTKVDVQLGIPSAYAASLPAAQLNGRAIVVRSEPIRGKGFGVQVALKFIGKPHLSTVVSMFD